MTTTHGPSTLPMECIEEIVQQLSPHARFQLATELRFGFVQRECLRFVTSEIHASAIGSIELLNLLVRPIGRTTLVPNELPNELNMNNALPAMFAASQKGHVHVLAWWKQMGGIETVEFVAWKDEMRTYLKSRPAIGMRVMFLADYIYNAKDAIFAPEVDVRSSVLKWWIQDGVTDLMFAGVPLLWVMFEIGIILVFTPPLILTCSSINMLNMMRSPTARITSPFARQEPTTFRKEIYYVGRSLLTPWWLAFVYISWRIGFSRK